MFQIILIVEIIIGILCLFMRKQGRLISLFILVFMFLNFTAAQSTMDSYAYSTAFEYICQGANYAYINSLNYGIDIGFYWFIKVIALFTNNYMVFRGIVFCVAMFFVLKGICLIDDKSIISLCLFLVFPFQYDTFQIEFFLAYSLITYGIALLICDADKATIKYLILVAIAFLIHIHTLPFILLLLFKLDNEMLRKILTGSIIIVALLNLVLRINFVSVLSKAFPFLNFGKYIVADDLNILTIIMSMSLFLTIYLYSLYINKRDYNDERIHTLFLMNSISLVFLPFIFTNLNAERFFRPLLIINYAYINKTAYLSDKKARYLEFAIIAMLVFRCIVQWEFYESNNNDIITYFFGGLR